MGPLEERVDRELRQALARDPAILAITTGERPFAGMTQSEIADMTLRMFGAYRVLLTDIAREIDAIKASADSGE
jgi:hypothetical protein